MRNRQPLVSVVVTTYTKARLPDVLSVLASLEAQRYPRLETIFVGEGEPELCTLVADYQRKQGLRNLVVLSNDGEKGLSAGRNLGLQYAQGDIIGFVDDDVVLSHDWAEEVVKSFADDEVIGVTGPALPLWDDPSMSWFPEELYWVISCTAWAGWDQVREVRTAWGMNMAFRREAFAIAGPFHNATGYHMGPFAEDNEFSLRVRARTGKRIVYVPGAKVWHRVHRYRLSRSFIRERAYWIGRSRRNLLRLHSAGDEDPLNLERNLLSCILGRRIPKDLAGLFKDRRAALRRLSVTLWALLFVALGYYHHLLPARSATRDLMDSEGVL